MTRYALRLLSVGFALMALPIAQAQAAVIWSETCSPIPPFGGGYTGTFSGSPAGGQCLIINTATGSIYFSGPTTLSQCVSKFTAACA